MKKLLGISLVGGTDFTEVGGEHRIGGGLQTPGDARAIRPGTLVFDEDDE